MSQSHIALEKIAELLGPEGWLTAPDRRAPYEREWRGYWNGSCLGVARPCDTAAVAQVVKLATNAEIPIVPHGGNTGLVAGGVPRNGIVISTEQVASVRRLDATNATVTVDAGCVLSTIQQVAADAGFYFPLSLGAEDSCRIGGNISTNAGGIAVLRYGSMRNLVLGLEVVLPDGRVWDGLRTLRKDNTGYDLKQLFIGAEGTLGVITGAVLKLFPAIRETVTALAGVGSWTEGLLLMNRLKSSAGETMSACEAMSREALSLAFDHISGLATPFENSYPLCVLVELTATRSDGNIAAVAEQALSAALEAGIARDIVIAQSEAQRATLWRLREAIPEAQSRRGASIKHDIAVPLSAIPSFVDQAGRYVRRRLPSTGVIAFGHLGDGNLHFNLSQPPGMSRDVFLGHWDEITSTVHDIAVQAGGSFSAEHGIGEIKRCELARLRSPVEIDMMRAIKQAFDPRGLMNPGKIIPD